MGIFTFGNADYKFEVKDGNKIVCYVKPVSRPLLLRLVGIVYGLILSLLFLFTLFFYRGDDYIFFLLFFGLCASFLMNPGVLLRLLFPARFEEAFYFNRDNRTLVIQKKNFSLLYALLQLPGTKTISADEIRSIHIGTGSRFNQLSIDDKTQTYKITPAMNEVTANSLKREVISFMHELFNLSFGGIKVYM